MLSREERTVSEATRRNIFDVLSAERIRWAGRLEEPAFLSRLFNLQELWSTDYRFSTAEDDIWQHRVRNRDWEDDWVFADPRFEFFRCRDEDFLKFLCETVHPVVRSNAEEVKWLIDTYNQHLVVDGWEIASCGELSGRAVFAGRRIIEGAIFAVGQAKRVAEAIDASYVSQQITRMERAVVSDVELAIGTAKEFIETICKTVLDANAVTAPPVDNLPQLVRATLKQLKLTPDEVPNSSKTANTIRVMLGNLATIAQGMAELRNAHGSGHGKEATVVGLGSRHARLAVGAATALGVFIFETFHEGSLGV